MKNKVGIQKWLIYVSLTIMIILSGCSGNADVSGNEEDVSSNEAEETEQKNEVVIAQGKDVDTLDPHKQSDTATGNVLTGIFDTLLRRDNEMNIQPSLATEYENVSDTEWEVKLREGVTFHNGEEFNADSVKFTFDRLMDPETKALSISYFTTLEEVEVIDEYTVRFTTSSYDPLFLSRLTNFYVLPPQYIEEEGDEEFAKNPVGTGPYKFVEWLPDEHVAMEANPDYFLGEPEIERVVWRPIPEMATRISALQGGQIDIVTEIPSDQVNTIENDENIEVVTGPSALIQMVNFNTEVSPADKKEFRLAVAHAIDVDSIVEGLFGEYAKATDVPISNVIPNAPKDVQRLPYDPEKSKELLEKSGLSGVEVEMTSQNGRAPLDKEIAQVIAEQLAEVGINVTVKSTDTNQFTDQLTSKNTTPLFLMAGNNVWFDADPQLVAFYQSDGPLSVYSNEEVDKLISEGSATKDEDKRKEIYSRAYETIRDDAGGIGILQYESIAAINNAIQWTPRADGRIWAYEITPR